MARADTSADRGVQRTPDVGVPNTARSAAPEDSEERRCARAIRRDGGPGAQRKRRQTGATARCPGACRRDRRRRNRRAGGRGRGRRAACGERARAAAASTGSGGADPCGRGHAAGAGAAQKPHGAAASNGPPPPRHATACVARVGTPWRRPARGVTHPPAAGGGACCWLQTERPHAVILEGTCPVEDHCGWMDLPSTLRAPLARVSHDSHSAGLSLGGAPPSDDSVQFRHACTKTPQAPYVWDGEIHT